MPPAAGTRLIASKPHVPGRCPAVGRASSQRALARPATPHRPETHALNFGYDGQRELRRAASRPAQQQWQCQGLYGQANVLQLANVVLALSPMNSVADQISPVGSANEAL